METEAGQAKPSVGQGSSGRVILLLVIVAATAAAALLWNGSQGPELPGGISSEQYQQAGDAFQKAFQRSADHFDRLMFLAELAVQRGQPEQAIACFGAIDSQHPRYGVNARFQEGQVLLRANRVASAEASFREFLTLAGQGHTIDGQAIPPEYVITAIRQLSYLLSVELRFEDRRPFLQQAHTAGLADVFDSKQYFFPSLLVWNSTLGSSRLEEFLELDPENRTLRNAKARYLTGEGRIDEALTLLALLWDSDPTDLTTAAALLECCFEQNDWSNFERIVSSLPEATADEPWLLTRLRGEHALHNQDWEQAEIYFRSVLEADRANPECHMGLAQALQRQGRMDEARVVQERSVILSRIRVDMSAIQESADALKAIEELAEACQQLQWPEAEAAFKQHAQRIMVPAN